MQTRVLVLCLVVFVGMAQLVQADPTTINISKQAGALTSASPTEAQTITLGMIYRLCQEALAMNGKNPNYRTIVSGNTVEIRRRGPVTLLLYREAGMLYGFDVATQGFGAYWISKDQEVAAQDDDLAFVLDSLQVALGHERTMKVIVNPTVAAAELKVPIDQFRQLLPIEIRTAKAHQGKLATIFVSAPSEFIRSYLARQHHFGSFPSK